MTRTTQSFAHDSPEQRATSKRRQIVPNLGPAIADDLMRLGIARPQALVGRDPGDLYRALCRLDGRRHDPCLWDVFPERKARAAGGGGIHAGPRHSPSGSARHQTTRGRR